MARILEQKWGNWRFKPETFVLEYEKEQRKYEVDLDDCGDSAEVLDWIIQVAEKAWMTPKDVGDLVMAINAVLRPQASMCSGGRNKRINPRTVAAERGYEGDE